jgi:hypothetical protein
MQRINLFLHFLIQNTLRNQATYLFEYFIRHKTKQNMLQPTKTAIQLVKRLIIKITPIHLTQLNLTHCDNEKLKLNTTHALTQQAYHHK